MLAPDSNSANGVPFRSVKICRLVPGRPRSVGFGPVADPLFRLDGGAIHAGSIPVQSIGVLEMFQQGLVEGLPDTGLMPVAEPSPASDAGTATHLLGQHLPGDPGFQDEQDSRQGGTIGYSWPAAIRFGRFRRQERLDDFPELIRYDLLRHATEGGRSGVLFQGF